MHLYKSRLLLCYLLALNQKCSCEITNGNSSAKIKLPQLNLVFTVRLNFIEMYFLLPK